MSICWTPSVYSYPHSILRSLIYFDLLVLIFSALKFLYHLLLLLPSISLAMSSCGVLFVVSLPVLLTDRLFIFDCVNYYLLGVPTSFAVPCVRKLPISTYPHLFLFYISFIFLPSSLRLCIFLSKVFLISCV